MQVRPTVVVLTLSSLLCSAAFGQGDGGSAGLQPDEPATPAVESGQAPPPEPTSPENVERAMGLAEDARGLYSQGKYDEAIDRLTEAVRLDPAAGTLFYNLGLIEEKVGRLDEARGHYQRALQLAETEQERIKLAKIIKRLEGAQQAKADPKPAQADSDASQPEPPPAGDRPHDRGVSPWVYITGATALAGLVVGAVLASRAAALDPGDELTTDAETSVADLQDDAAAAHAFAIGADVGFIVGGAAAAACLVIAVVVDEDASAASALRVNVRPTGAEMVWHF